MEDMVGASAHLGIPTVNFDRAAACSKISDSGTCRAQPGLQDARCLSCHGSRPVMKDKAQAAWQWTTGTTKAAANATVAGTCKVAAQTFEMASPVARAVAGKRKDAAGVAVGTAAVQASVVPTLNWFGWSSIGPVAGSYASSLMAGYAGAVPAGALV